MIHTPPPPRRAPACQVCSRGIGVCAVHSPVPRLQHHAGLPPFGSAQQVHARKCCCRSGRQPPAARQRCSAVRACQQPTRARPGFLTCCLCDGTVSHSSSSEHVHFRATFKAVAAPVTRCSSSTRGVRVTATASCGRLPMGLCCRLARCTLVSYALVPVVSGDSVCAVLCLCIRSSAHSSQAFVSGFKSSGACRTSN